MDYRNTRISFLKEDCINEFGQEAGAKIYNQSCELLTSMLAKADYRNNESIKEHISTNMFPTIAYYLTLQKCGYSKEDAYSLTLKKTQKAAHIQKNKNRAFAKMPFAYTMFKFLVKGIMKKMYPLEGWETEWVRFDNKEIHLNFKRCIYMDLTDHHGCPELCTVFCQNDPVSFSGYEPKIHFERSGTLADGAICCDFHFIRGSR
ncbi:MAG: L-2-amino-thiazoline-4-carboxylic acid hydrolase [Spirochaetales bacterium]|nr:L-2-amino-thiazoline-4-carboxylic acid hydrolase [Spirochaetales bacterium]